MSANKQSKSPHRGKDDPTQAVYAEDTKIYPRQVHGTFAQLRLAAVVVLLGIFYGLPWLRWEDHQAVLLDLPARKFYLFGLTLWPQDFIYLAFLLAMAGFCLFFFTSLAGRLWCGYACPQTVWTEIFLWMEHGFEGDRLQQMKLDSSRMSWRKFRIKFTKHTLWIIFSVFTGFTFVSYFTPQDVLFHEAMALNMGTWEIFWIIFYGFATYGNAGFLREQVCKYMCPYARFQCAMFDKDTLIISYDEKRGEPRGPRGHNADPKALGLGACIDCTMCVQVCPTGIDIRNGLQYECIGCSACIDVCDDVMDRMDYPKGLIRYTTQHAMDGNETHVFRPRVLVYAGILAILMGGLSYSIVTRTPLHLDVLRDRNQLFRETEQGLIENVYSLKIMNMDDKPHDYRIGAEGLDGLILKTDSETFHVESGQVVSVPARIQINEDQLEKRSSKVEFTVTATDQPDLSAEEDTRFLGPLP